MKKRLHYCHGTPLDDRFQFETSAEITITRHADTPRNPDLSHRAPHPDPPTNRQQLVD